MSYRRIRSLRLEKNLTEDHLLAAKEGPHGAAAAANPKGLKTPSGSPFCGRDMSDEEEEEARPQKDIFIYFFRAALPPQRPAKFLFHLRHPYSLSPPKNKRETITRDPRSILSPPHRRTPSFCNHATLGFHPFDSSTLQP